MTKRQVARVSLVAFSLAVALAGVAGTKSAATAVHLDADDSYLWRTVRGTTLDLRWSAAPDATGTLEVTGRGYAKTVSVTGQTCQLELPAPMDASAENLYDLRLTLDDGSVRTARLAAVCGTGSGGEAVKAAYRDPGNARRWARVVRHAVLPIPPGAESLTVNGETVALELDGAAGWHQFVDEGPGEYVLELDGSSQTLRSVDGGLFVEIH